MRSLSASLEFVLGWLVVCEWWRLDGQPRHRAELRRTGWEPELRAWVWVAKCVAYVYGCGCMQWADVKTAPKGAE